MNQPDIDQDSTRFSWLALTGSLGGLIVLCVLWEIWLAPLRPGSFLLALKAVPLILPLAGALRRSVYTLQWSSMLIWLYFVEGVVRGFRNPDFTTSVLAWLEVALVLVFFVAALLFLRPYKRAAKAQARAAAASHALQDSHPATDSQGKTASPGANPATPSPPAGEPAKAGEKNPAGEQA